MELSDASIIEVEATPEDIGSFDDMKVGQKLIVPVCKSDEDDDLVFYGCLDFKGDSNQLEYDDWVRFTEEFTGIRPEGRTILKKSKKLDGVCIWAKAHHSLGGGDLLEVYNSVFELLDRLVKDDIVNDIVKRDIEKAIKSKDIENAIRYCKRIFHHIFLTGLIYIGLEYVSGYKPDGKGYTSNELQ